MSTALLLVGSPKPKASASRAIGEDVMSRIAAQGWDTDTARVPTDDRDGTATVALIERMSDADLVVLSFPLYIDTLPAPVTALVERWYASLRGGGSAGRPRLAVLVQCGFPEAAHTEVAVDVCRSFARHAGLPWAGAVAFGMGGALAGGSLERSPWARFAPQLDRAASELTAGRPIPAEVTDVFARPAMPRFLYLTAGNVGWHMEARKNRCTEPIRYRRYAQ